MKRPARAAPAKPEEQAKSDQLQILKERAHEIHLSAKTAALKHLYRYQRGARLPGLSPNEENASGIASEVLVKMLNGTRHWSPDKGDVLEFAASAARSEVSNLATSAENQLRQVLDDDIGQTAVVDLSAQFSSPDPELHLQEYVANSTSMARAVCQALPDDGYDIEKAIVDLVLARGVVGTSQQKNYLEQPEEVITKAKKRLSRHLKSDGFAKRIVMIVCNR